MKTYYFQHPKAKNGILTIKGSPVEFEQDQFGRNGIFKVPDVPDAQPMIKLLKSIGLKDIGEPTAKETADQKAIKKSETGLHRFKHPSKSNVTLHTSAGDIVFKDAVTEVSGAKADILIALSYKILGAQGASPDAEKERIAKEIAEKEAQDQIGNDAIEAIKLRVFTQNELNERSVEDVEEILKIKGIEFAIGTAKEDLIKLLIPVPEGNKLTIKQLKAIAKKNDIDATDLNEEGLTALLKEKNLI